MRSTVVTTSVGVAIEAGLSRSIPQKEYKENM